MGKGYTNTVTTAAGIDDSMIGKADNWPAGGRLSFEDLHVVVHISYSGLFLREALPRR